MVSEVDTTVVFISIDGDVMKNISLGASNADSAVRCADFKRAFDACDLLSAAVADKFAF